jgi:hypothetical protein
MQSLPKSLFVFLFCVPLAVVFGVMLATPLDRNTMFAVLGGFLVLLTPILLKHHHAFLILSWNAFINAFFLPGKPYIWMLATAISCFFIVLTGTLNRGKMPLTWVSSIAHPLIFLFIVTAVTAKVTGGVGAQVFGSEVYGGKRYLFLWGAIAGFFALSSIPVNPEKRQFLAAGFAIAGVTAIASNIAYMLGESFYYLFLLFPAEWAIAQAASETVGGFTRIGGLSPASIALLSFALIRWGLKGCLEIRKPWRGALVIAAIVACLFSGFRATLLTHAMLLGIQFFVEGLHRTKMLLTVLLIAVIAVTAAIPFANKLPLSVQRCLTVLPLDLDRGAIEAARGSTEWRLEMWRAIIPDIPQYLLIGKGYALDPKDMYFSQAHISVRHYAPYEASLVAGDYHNGPLTLIIPFGIWGVIGFVWFWIASYNVLRRNLQYGDESIKNINRFLLTYFITKVLFFLFIFGAFYLDLGGFVGIVGLSVCMNRGVAKPAYAPAAALVPVEPQTNGHLTWQPAFRRRLQGA